MRSRCPEESARQGVYSNAVEMLTEFTGQLYTYIYIYIYIYIHKHTHPLVGCGVAHSLSGPAKSLLQWPWRRVSHLFSVYLHTLSWCRCGAAWGSVLLRRLVADVVQVLGVMMWSIFIGVDLFDFIIPVGLVLSFDR